MFVDGVNQYGPGAQYAYLETDSDTVTFVNGLHVGALVKFTTSQLNSSGATDASQVSYTPSIDSLLTTQNNVQDALDAMSDKASGADYVGFNVNETASIDRTVTSKLQDFVSVKDFGAIGNGTIDDAPALTLAFTAWADAATAGTPFKLYVPPGEYKIGSTIDLRTMFAAQNYYGLDFEMSASASFIPTANIGVMLYWACPEGGGFTFCSFKFGQIGGGLLSGNNTGVFFKNVSDSTIYFQSVTAWKNSSTGVGVRFNCSTANGIYNNLITIETLNDNYIGLLANDSNTPPHGFQGNLITIGHCAFNDFGVWLQNQSTSNTFNIACLESNISKAILDQAGYNIYKVNFSDESAGNEIELGTANGRVDIEGYGLLLNNTGNATGWVKDNKASITPLAPTIPASNNPYQNLFERPATVSISGGSNVSIFIDGVAAGASGSFSVPYGSFVTIIYTSAPTWLWTFN